MTQTQKTTDSDSKNMEFNADVARLLDIVANALYSNSDVFLRELISNASDACDRLRYDAIESPDLIDGDADYRIEILSDTSARTITIIDNGIGMSQQDMIDHLGTIAKSGTRAIMEQVKNAKTQNDGDLNLIGQFGVGFYASFMVASQVEVISRRAGDQESATSHWQSDGASGFDIRPASTDEADKLIANRGTAIILHIKGDHSQLFLDEKIRNIVETYSDHIDIPIYLGAKNDPTEDGADPKPLNQASALWARSKDDITPEQYKEFYWHLSSGITMDEPLVTAHWRAEGMIEFSSLLYIPTMRPFDLFDPAKKHGVRLYVRRIYITDQCEGLMYPWLRFVRGVIDSQDLPLNISREMLQHNPVVTKIRTNVTRRILSDLDKLSRDDTAAFDAFWEQFGSVIKEGLYDTTDHRSDIFKICRFRTSHDNGAALHSLKDYIEQMHDNQKNIYYISGEKLDSLINSPQLEGFKARGLNVLLLTDPIDEFWIQMVQDFEGKTFRSITKGDIDLSTIPLLSDAKPSQNTRSSEKTAKDKNDKDNKSDKMTAQETVADIAPLLSKLSHILKDDIGQVRASSRLTSSPVCLIAGDQEPDMRTEQILRIQQKYDAHSKRILEINPNHSLIQYLNEICEIENRQDDVAQAAQTLLDQARIIQGEPVSDLTRFAQNLSQFMELSLKG